MKDIQGALRHASIKTAGDVYLQPIPSSVRAAINARTEEILAGSKAKTTWQPEGIAKTQDAMQPNARIRVLQVLERIGSSGRTRTYNPPVNSRSTRNGVDVLSMISAEHKGDFGALSAINGSKNGSKLGRGEPFSLAARVKRPSMS